VSLDPRASEAPDVNAGTPLPTAATIERELDAGRSKGHLDTVFEVQDGSDDQRLVMNFGPQHPATHGTLRSIFTLEGETITEADVEIGYLHTGFEKLAENMTYQQWVTVTDRMNYLSAINNNVGYAIAVEELLGIEVPPRCQALRVILCELSRIADHVLCVGLQAMDLGAFSVMLWSFEKREVVYDIIEAVCGARLTTSWTRVGGIIRDVPPNFSDLVWSFVNDFPKLHAEIHYMLSSNRIFKDRVQGVGVVDRESALSWGLSGPSAGRAGSSSMSGGTSRTAATTSTSSRSRCRTPETPGRATSSGWRRSSSRSRSSVRPSPPCRTAPSSMRTSRPRSRRRTRSTTTWSR
jgi:hypothetical protein